MRRIIIGYKDLYSSSTKTKLEYIFREYFPFSISLKVYDVYAFDFSLDNQDLGYLANELFVDRVIQDYCIDELRVANYHASIEIAYLPGVKDNIGESALKGAKLLLGSKIPNNANVFSSKLIILSCIDSHNLASMIAHLGSFAKEHLYNNLIQQIMINEKQELIPFLNLKHINLPGQTEIHTIPMKQYSDQELLNLSEQMLLSLNLEEMKAIKAYFYMPDEQHRRSTFNMPNDPTGVEIEVIAQTWSEHCKHKIFNAHIHYEKENGEIEEINSLFKSYIKRVTDELKPKKDYLLSVFKDNAGVIRFDKDFAICMKVETHNSPSALDPYGGSLTGIVGVNRDVLGTGLVFKPIFNTDVFCFADPNYKDDLPPKLLHPKRIMEGVHEGIIDGGNQSGIPTVNGSIYFDNSYLGKPLVFCGTGGMAPIETKLGKSYEKYTAVGDYVVMVGGRVGKDGIHGATFSSLSLTESSPTSAVQIGDPITQKKMTDFLIEARDQGLFSGITDNGAGGLSSSCGEMALLTGGCVLQLDKIPLKYKGLEPWEIIISESQERMSLSVPAKSLDELIVLASKHDVEATVIGNFTSSGYFEAYYDDQKVMDLRLDFLHDGVPQLVLKAKQRPKKASNQNQIENSSEDLKTILLQILSSLNVTSKESFVRRYDQEVQARTILKPFTGKYYDGPSDASILLVDTSEKAASKKALVISHGMCPHYCQADSYQMALHAVDEALRNAVCVGVNIQTLSGLDNFCWPDPIQSVDTPDGHYKLGDLVETCKGLYDACQSYEIPLISGKDSMKNDYGKGENKISILPTLLFSLIGTIEDYSTQVSMDFKDSDHLIYLVGKPSSNLGYSTYAKILELSSEDIPKVSLEGAKKCYHTLNKLQKDQRIASCHDISDGGMITAIIESCIAGRKGVTIDLSSITGDHFSIEEVLFSEPASSFIISIAPKDKPQFEAELSGHSFYRIGTTSGSNEIQILNGDELLLSVSLAEVLNAWKSVFPYDGVS